MFTMACIDRQMEIEKKKKQKKYDKWLDEKLKEKRKLDEEFKKHKHKLAFVTAFLPTKRAMSTNRVAAFSRETPM